MFQTSGVFYHTSINDGKLLEALGAIGKQKPPKLKFYNWNVADNLLNSMAPLAFRMLLVFSNQ